jgi:hypothetical protein
MAVMCASIGARIGELGRAKARLSLVFDGLRTERAGVTPLPVPALLPEEMETTMRQRATRHPGLRDMTRRRS